MNTALSSVKKYFMMEKKNDHSTKSALKLKTIADAWLYHCMCRCCKTTFRYHSGGVELMVLLFNVATS